MARLIPGKNDFATLCPEAAKEWHFSKNGELMPDRVTVSSNKLVWWKCRCCGHEWQTKPGTRAKGHGCKICGRKKANKSRSINAAGKGNSIAEINPALADEWDYANNPPDRNPSNVSPWSDTKYHWICPECKTSYPSSVTNRSSGQGCPICAERNRPISRHNTQLGINGSLTQILPEIAAEWNYEKNLEEHQTNERHPTSPDDVTPGAKENVWWECPQGHEYRAMVYSRKAGTGCPVCAAERKTSFQEQVLFYYLSQITTALNRYNLDGNYEIDIYLPGYQIGIEYDGSAWHTDLEKDLIKNCLCEDKGIRLLRIREPGCPDFPKECIQLSSRSEEELSGAVLEICSIIGKAVDVNIGRDRTAILERYISQEKQNSFAARYPLLALEWHPTKNGTLTPTAIAPKSNKPFWWLGACGHEYLARASGRARGNGCPYCAGKKILKGYNDLASQYPELAAQWHPTKNGDLTPEQVTPGSHKEVRWLYPCGHEGYAQIKSRVQGNGCRECAGKKNMGNPTKK